MRAPRFYLYVSDSSGRRSPLSTALTALSFEADPMLVVLQANVLFSCFPLQHDSVIGTDGTINLNFPVPAGESFNLRGFLYSPAPPVRYQSFLNKHTSQLPTRTLKVQGISANFFSLDILDLLLGDPRENSVTPGLNIWRSYPPLHSGSVLQKAQIQCTALPKNRHLFVCLNTSCHDPVPDSEIWNTSAQWKPSWTFYPTSHRPWMVLPRAPEKPSKDVM